VLAHTATVKGGDVSGSEEDGEEGGQEKEVGQFTQV
jgi:hypothetical protein